MASNQSTQRTLAKRKIARQAPSNQLRPNDRAGTRLARRDLFGLAGSAVLVAAAPRLARGAGGGSGGSTSQFPQPSSGKSSIQIVYPRQGKGNDPRDRYPTDLLRFALEKAGVRFTFHYTDDVFTQKRAVIAAQDQYGANIVHAGASKAFARKLDPIYFPTFRGLLGYRVFLINADKQPEFSRIRSLADLQNYRAVQGIGWPDVKILRNAGLPVDTGFYNTLFRRVAQGYDDYFPRSVIEILPEMSQYQSKYPQLAIEDSLGLSYRFSAIFYTSPSAKPLNEALKAGLWQSYHDGSFFDFFNQHPVIKHLKKNLNLEKRRFLELKNPTQPAKMQDTPDDLWLRITRS